MRCAIRCVAWRVTDSSTLATQRNATHRAAHVETTSKGVKTHLNDDTIPAAQLCTIDLQQHQVLYFNTAVRKIENTITVNHWHSTLPSQAVNTHPHSVPIYHYSPHLCVHCTLVAHIKQQITIGLQTRLINCMQFDHYTVRHPFIIHVVCCFRDVHLFYQFHYCYVCTSFRLIGLLYFTSCIFDIHNLI